MQRQGSCMGCGKIGLVDKASPELEIMLCRACMEVWKAPKTEEKKKRGRPKKVQTETTPVQVAEPKMTRAVHIKAPILRLTDDGDPVNNPPHYTKGRKYEPIDVIEDWGLGFNLGNAVKYISRAGRKDDALQDLEKAEFYLKREIRRLKK